MEDAAKKDRPPHINDDGESANNNIPELARRAATGDERAFGEFVEATHGVVFRLASRLVGSQAVAEDVTQETYIRTWQSMAKLRDPGAALGWVCRIARNVATDHLRKQSRRRVESLDRQLGDGMDALVDRLVSDAPGPDQIVLDAEMKAALESLIDSLKDKYRVVFMLREVDGMTYEEIAAAIGVPVGTVESRLHRARKMLAQKLERMHKRQRSRS